MASKKIDPLYVKLEAEMHDKLRQQAAKERRTKAELVRSAITRYLLSIDRAEEN